MRPSIPEFSLLPIGLLLVSVLIVGCQDDIRGPGWSDLRDSGTEDTRADGHSSDMGVHDVGDSGTDARDASACGDCETGQYCSPRDRCEPRRRCADENHALCPPGHWCDEDDDVCRPSQGKAVGEPCEEGYECASGKCDATEKGCVSTCLSDADCPAPDEKCGYGQQMPHQTCDEDRTCSASCTGYEVCGRDECRPPLCYRTADCPKGDCLMYPGKYGARDTRGQCNVQGESLCEGYEFRIAEDDPYCRLPIDCWGIYGDVEDPCPEGYECVHDGNTTNSPSATEWCARRVTDGEWSRP